MGFGGPLGWGKTIQHDAAIAHGDDGAVRYPCSAHGDTRAAECHARAADAGAGSPDVRLPLPGAGRFGLVSIHAPRLSGGRHLLLHRCQWSTLSAEDLWSPATVKTEDRSGLAVAIIDDDSIRYYGSHLS